MKNSKQQGTSAQTKSAQSKTQDCGAKSKATQSAKSAATGKMSTKGAKSCK